VSFGGEPRRADWRSAQCQTAMQWDADPTWKSDLGLDADTAIKHMSTVVPISLLVSRYAPRGMRPLKWPKFEPPRHEWLPRHYQDIRLKSQQSVGPFPSGNLVKHEYQFWRGSRKPEWMSAYCRVCNYLTFNPFERKRHFAEHPCARVLVESMKKFQARTVKMCACGCSRPPKLSCWGFGFFDRKCMEEWCFDLVGMSHVLSEIINEEREKWEPGSRKDRS
jgi:hypothetical protein